MFELSPLLAYETGVHLGDGNLTCKKEWNLFRVTYAGNRELDSKYFESILPGIIQSLYGKEPRIYHPKNENTVLVVLNSRKVVRFKMDTLGLPSGSKKKLESFPKNLTDKYPADILRGIADTDFCFYVNGREPRICASFCSPVFATELSQLMKRLGIKHQVRRLMRRERYKEYQISVCGKKQLLQWMQKVGFWNPKHSEKVRDYFKASGEEEF
jgi:hypothetical protein